MNLGKKISIVIVNWNTGLYLQKCLKSILKNKNNFINKIVVVDNASTDNSHKIIPRSKKIILLKNKNNLGFARACNQGAALLKSKYILFLNPDTRLLKNTLKKVLIFMECAANSNIGICGVKMITKKNDNIHIMSNNKIYNKTYNELNNKNKIYYNNI
jgi:GT2 family glycosyltransferase